MPTQLTDSDRIQLLSSKESFGKAILGMDFPIHQKLWIRDIQSSKGNLVYFSAADHGKTTIFSLLNILHEIVLNRDIRVILACNVDDLAEAIGRAIKHHLQYTIPPIFGDFYYPGTQWNDNAFTVVRKNESPFPTFLGIGVGSSVLGRRADLIICDDILDQKNSSTSGTRNKVKNWFWESLMTRLEPDGRMIVVGNPQHYQDLYHDLIKIPSFTFKKFPAILDETERRTLWPEKWSYEKLLGRRIQEPLAFAKMYQCVPLNEYSVLTKDTIDASLNYDRTMLSHYEQKSGAYKRIWISVDPAFTTNIHSSYTVVLVIGEKEDLKFDILRCERRRTAPRELKNLIRFTISNFECDTVFLETTGTQVSFFDEIKSLIPAVQFVPIKTSSKKNSVDYGVVSMLQAIETGIFNFPYGDQDSKRMTDVLIDEVLQYPNGVTDDMLMALYIFWQGRRPGIKKDEDFSVRKPEVIPLSLRRRSLSRRILSRIG